MQLQQRPNRLGGPSAESALCGYAKIGNERSSHRQPSLGSLDAVCDVNKPEVQFGPRRELKVLQGCEVRLIVTIARHRHMEPIDWTADRSRDVVVKPDHVAHIDGLSHV